MIDEDQIKSLTKKQLVELLTGILSKEEEEAPAKQKEDKKVLGVINSSIDAGERSAGKIDDEYKKKFVKRERTPVEYVERNCKECHKPVRLVKGSIFDKKKFICNDCLSNG